MKPYEILKAAAELPWTQGEAARDANGIPCEPWSKRAVCFCVHGAITKAGLNAPFRVRQEARDEMEAFVGSNLRFWNDAAGRTAKDAKAALLDCAELLETEEMIEAGIAGLQKRPGHAA